MQEAPSGGDGASWVKQVDNGYCCELPPLEPLMPPVLSVSGVSGFMLSINCSTGMVAGAADSPGAAVSGVCIGVLEFGGRKGCGYFGVAISVPAGTGLTSSGVTMTISSVLFLVR